MHETKYFFLILVGDALFDTIFWEIGAFQFLTHVKLSGSMAAILEIPQYVAYQKNDALLSLYTKSRTFNKYRTIMSFSCA